MELTERVATCAARRAFIRWQISRARLASHPRPDQPARAAMDPPRRDPVATDDLSEATMTWRSIRP
jgi:hypothetical protein